MDGWNEHDAGQVADPGQLRECRLIPNLVQGHSLRAER
jgi:hypothetical protein